jgi:hypothetical protein
MRHPFAFGLFTLSLCLPPGSHATTSPGLAGDPTALGHLVQAVSLDVMTEASLMACDDIGAPSTPQLRAAWVAWREQHQLGSLRTVVQDLRRRQGSKSLPWETMTEPMRQRVLADVNPDAICAALARDLQSPGMDATALYPQALATAMAVVQAGLASRHTQPAVAPGTPRGQLLLPSQIPTLAAQTRADLPLAYVKGRVARWGTDQDRYKLVSDRGDRSSGGVVYLECAAESWVGREVVMQGKLRSLSAGSATLGDAALVTNASGLTPSPLAQAPLERREVLLQRVLAAPGKGLPIKDLAAIVIHGQGNYNSGSRWEEDVRFLLRDGTFYSRTDMPPDQLNVTASRALEPQRWGRWRAAGKAYEMQPQDSDGRGATWKPEQHRAVRPWPDDTRLAGSYSRSSFAGSQFSGGISATQGIRFTQDGRFERSYHSLGTSGSIAAAAGTMISGAAHGDGRGSTTTGGGTVAGGLGSSTTTTQSSKDDGASRRGRYQLSGYALTLTYDDGRQERLLSFPVYDDSRTVYVGDGSMSLAK